MNRAYVLFTLAAVLSILTFYNKSEPSYDYYLAIPIGLYFIGALLFSSRPKVGWSSLLQFSGLALLLWLVLYSLSYSLLFVIIAPVAGGIGAWLITLLSRHFLQLSLPKLLPIIITGVVTALLGVLFMIIVREMPKETYTIGLKAGVVTAFWQLGVGVQLVRNQKIDTMQEEK